MNYQWKLQKFDTDHFGWNAVKISSIATSENPQETKNHVLELIDDLKKNEIAYAVYRFNAANFPLIHALEESDFLLIDGLIALENYPIVSDTIDNVSIREAKQVDLNALQEIAKDVFTLTRFYTDPLIPVEKANALYEKWIENSLLGIAADKVLVCEEEGQVVGFVTLQKRGHIPLIAVAKSAQGKGIAKKLIKGSFLYFRQWGVKKMAIETQSINIPALRSYQSCGFKITNSYLTFRWANGIKS